MLATQKYSRFNHMYEFCYGKIFNPFLRKQDEGIVLGAIEPIGTTFSNIVRDYDWPLQYKWGITGSANGEFNNPESIVIYNNEIIICDKRNHRIQVYELDGTFLRQWGTFGRGIGQFEYPNGLAICNDMNEIFVCDKLNNRIQVFRLNDNSFVRMFNTNSPTGIAICGNLVFVTNNQIHSIQCFQTDGMLIREWGSLGTNPGQFNSPYGITVSSITMELFVCDMGNHRVQVFDFDGNFLRQWGSLGTQLQFPQTQYPQFITLTLEGDVLVTDLIRDSGRIQQFTPDGTIVREINPATYYQDIFWPTGLAVTSTGYMVVGDFHNNCVYVEFVGH